MKMPKPKDEWIRKPIIRPLRKTRRTALKKALEAFLIELPDSTYKVKRYAAFFRTEMGVITYLKPFKEPLFKYMKKEPYHKPRYYFEINLDEAQPEDIADIIRQFRKKIRVYLMDYKKEEVRMI